MNYLLAWLTTNGFTGLLLTAAVACGLALLIRYALRRQLSPGLLVIAVGCMLTAAGSLFLAWEWGVGIASTAVLVMVGMFVVLFSSSHWSAILAWVCAALFALGLGALVGSSANYGLEEVARMATSTTFIRPEWLAMLGLVPLVFLFSFRDVRWWQLALVVLIAGGASVAAMVWGPTALANLPPNYPTMLILLGACFLVQAVCLAPLFWTPVRRSLAGLGTGREIFAVSLRCLLVLFLALALAEPQVRQQSQDTTVLFLVDRSLSVPEEPSEKTGPAGLPLDARWERIKEFINASVASNSKTHPRDKAGLVVFGRRPRLELPPAAVPRFLFTDVLGQIDGNYTDLAAALKLALASFPENSGKRVVVFSDGNENIGLVEEQAKNAKINGVQIDVVPLGTGQRNEAEVLVQGIEAPSKIEQGAKVPLRVLIRSMNPKAVYGRLFVRQMSGNASVEVAYDLADRKPGQRVVLKQGLNVFPFKQPSTKDERSYTYVAEFQPDVPIAGDRVQNNRATTHVVAHGQRRILVIESKKGEHEFMIEKLREAGNNKFTIESELVDTLPVDKGELGAKLSEYDALILANVAASDVTEEGVKNDVIPGVLTKEQQEVIRSAVHDQGLGLVMVGGKNGFGAGGWQDTPIEKALPVDCDIKAIEVEGKGGLVLIMHASEMADGNRWQKIIGKLAIKKLSPSDEISVLQYDFATGGIKSVVKMQQIGDKRDALLALVDGMSPGDMPDFSPALQQAYNDLVKGRTDENRLATKHVIVISDGDPQQSVPNFPTTMRNAQITVTTVGVATHGAPQDQALAGLARATGGRFYNVKSPNALPEIYTKETRLVSQSFVHEKRFQPALLMRTGPTEGLDALPPLYGFVRTTAKPSPLVDTSILSPEFKGMTFPILSYWPYGLGKSVAFTSDARKIWDKEWANSEMYSKFWQQTLEWCLRPVESKKLTMTTEYRDGKVRVVIEARDDKGQLDPTITKLVGKVTFPNGQIDEKGLKFEMKNVGVFEAEFKAEEAGSYFVTAGPVKLEVIKDKDGNVKGKTEALVDRVSGGTTVPYSPEFSDVATNTDLLKRLATETGGHVYADEKTMIDEAGQVYRPTPQNFRSLDAIWWWLVTAVGVLLFFDVAVRRIAIEPTEVVGTARSIWAGLRGQAREAKVPEYMERLRSRKAVVSETLKKDKATRRFDAPERVGAPPPSADVPATVGEAPSRPSAPVRTPGGVAPDSERAPEDYASRLMRAKRKAMESKDKPKNENS